MNTKDYAKYFFVLIFIGVIYLSYLVVKPFITAVLTGAILAYIFYPIYKWVTKKINNETIAALVVALLIIVATVTPVLLLFNQISTEGQYLYVRAKQKVVSGNLLGINCVDNVDIICRMSNFAKTTIQDPQINLYLQDTITKGTDYLVDTVSNILLAIPVIILNIFVAFFVMFYLFKQGKQLILRLKKILPLKKAHQNYILKGLKETVFAVVYGSIIVAFIQGILGGIGFWIFGINSPLTWGIIMIMFAFVPFLGTAFIWLPAALIVIIAGSSENNVDMVWKGVGLLIWGTLVVGSADNLLKPRIIGDKSGLHPALVLLGVFGGLAVFGFIGVVIGPIILALLMTFIHLYEKERK